MLNVEIVTPSHVAFSGEATEVSAPGILGEFDVLPDHALMLSVTGCGVVTLFGGETRKLLVGTGFAEVGPDRITLLVDLCESVDDIDKEQASLDMASAEEVISRATLGTPEYTAAERDLALARARVDA